MAIGANSYGTAAGVAALRKRYTASGSFSAATNPTLTELEGFIDQISANVNVLLAQNGFVIPVSTADAKLSLDGLVNQLAADLVDYANGTGRLTTKNVIERGIAPFKIVESNIAAWIADHAVGLENLGARRTTTEGAGIFTLNSDDGHIFKRNDYGFRR